MHEVVEESINIMLECFSGEDGGLAFIKFKQLMTSFANQAAEGDEAAVEIINRVRAVAKLITYSKGL